MDSPVNLPSRRPVAELELPVTSAAPGSAVVSFPAWAVMQPSRLVASRTRGMDFMKCIVFLNWCDGIVTYASHTA